MAKRKPIVIDDNGNLTELPNGDSILGGNSWLQLVMSHALTTPPVLVGTTADGEVKRYNNGTVDYYRQYSDDKTKQAFYLNWDGTTLSDLIVSRIIQNI